MIRIYNIRQGRERKGLSLQDCADAIDVTKQTWWNWEIGKTSPTHLERIVTFFASLGMEVTEDDIKSNTSEPRAKEACSECNASVRSDLLNHGICLKCQEGW